MMTRREQWPSLALSVGEPAGIGPDIIANIATRDIEAKLVCIADPKVIAARAEQLGLELEIAETSRGTEIPPHQPGRLVVLPVKTHAPVTAGELDAKNATYVLNCLDIAIELAKSKHVKAIVTGPVHKGVINDAGHNFTGHTEYLATSPNSPIPVMMLASGSLRVALVTTHMALHEVPANITVARVGYIINVVTAALTKYFGIEHPRVAVCGLNPHAGENGHFGSEDDAIIAPAIARARTSATTLLGPMPADTAFAPEVRGSIDAYIAMYHDQGLPVIKALGFGEIVNITLGLPILRTSVDHGTALDIAGTGLARPDSLLAAISVAIDLSSH